MPDTAEKKKKTTELYRSKYGWKGTTKDSKMFKKLFATCWQGDWCHFVKFSPFINHVE